MFSITAPVSGLVAETIYSTSSKTFGKSKAFPHQNIDTYDPGLKRPEFLFKELKALFKNFKTLRWSSINTHFLMKMADDIRYVRSLYSNTSWDHAACELLVLT